MEMQILDWIQSVRAPWLDRLMVAVTSLGNGGAIWVICAAGLALRRQTRSTGAAVAVALALEILCCNALLKPLVARVRPCDVNAAIELLVSRPTDYSFPSGHTGASFAAASALFFERSKLRFPAGGIAALIAFSRLYLYVHYLSDVLAAALLGLLLGWVGRSVVQGALKARSHPAKI